MTDLYRHKPTDWMVDAACAGLDSSLFFAEKEDAGPSPYAEGQAVCRRCPARRSCLEFAMAEPIERFGLFGGMTPKDRNEERKRRAALRAVRRSA